MGWGDRAGAAGRSTAAALVVAATISAWPATATAADHVIDVSSTVDSHAQGTLRWAIDQADAMPVVPGDSITVRLPAGTYDLTLCASNPPGPNAAGGLDVLAGAPFALVGIGGQAVIRLQCPNDHVIDAGGSAGSIRLADVTISGGNGVAEGAGLLADGDVVLDHATFQDNHAVGVEGVSLPCAAWPPVRAAAGGAVRTTGGVDATASTFADNTATGGAGDATYPQGCSGPDAAGGARGGAIDADGEVRLRTGSTAQGNVATGGAGGGDATLGFAVAAGNGYGGAVASRSTVLVDHSTLSGNAATGGAPNGSGRGGGIAATGAVSVDASTIAANHARASASPATCGGGVGQGGGVDTDDRLVLTDSLLSQNTAVGEDGAPGDPAVCRSLASGGHGLGGGAFAGAAVTITGSSATGNEADGGDGAAAPPASATGGDATGGAVLALGPVTIGRSTIAGNVVRSGSGVPVGAALGGGVYAASGADVASSTFEADVATSGIGTENAQGLTSARGGGLFANTSVTVTQSTFSQNRAAGVTPPGGGTPTFGAGGGIAAAGSVAVTNATFDANQATEAVAGAAVQAWDLTLVSSTVTANIGTSALGHDGGHAPLALHVTQSVLAGQVGGVECQATSTTSGGSSWSDDASCGLADPTDHQDAGDPALGPLGANGGATTTRVPLAGSPLVDVIPPSSCAVAVDQRSVTRPQGPGCDIGAVERRDEPPTTTTTSTGSTTSTAPTTSTSVAVTPASTGAPTTFRVTALTSTSGTLPATGSSTAPLAGIGVVLLAGGAGLLRVGRRRAT